MRAGRAARLPGSSRDAASVPLLVGTGACASVSWQQVAESEGLSTQREKNPRTERSKWCPEPGAERGPGSYNQGDGGRGGTGRARAVGSQGCRQWESQGAIFSVMLETRPLIDRECLKWTAGYRERPWWFCRVTGRLHTSGPGA